MRKFNVLDLFSGAGGLSYGFKLAGFKIAGAVEWDKAAMETHKKNFNSGFEYCGDIKDITDDTILSIKNIDVIIGGPPCQGFSSANRQEKELNDPRNKLFYEYLILELTEKMGYNVSVKVLDASNYGVPQVRRRAIFVGIKKDLCYLFDFDDLRQVKKPVTVYEAIGDICYPDLNMSNEFLKYAKDSDTLYNHNPRFPNDKVKERISYVPQGGNWRNVPEYLWDTKRTNRHSSAYKRLAFDEPSITIDTGHMNYFHPVENRVPTVRESARLQSFPDSFIFCGNQSEQYRQVGNAVPPLLGKAIATQIMKILKEKVNEN